MSEKKFSGTHKKNDKAKKKRKHSKQNVLY